MRILTTKYFGIHTDRVRAALESIGRGRNLEEKRLADEILGKSRESKRTLENAKRDFQKRREKLRDKGLGILSKYNQGEFKSSPKYREYDELLDKSIELDERQAGVEYRANANKKGYDRRGGYQARREWWKESSNKSGQWRYAEDPSLVKEREDFYDKIANKIWEDYSKEKVNSRSLREWLTDRKVNNEIIDFVKKNYPDKIEDIKKDSLIDIVKNHSTPFGDPYTGITRFDPNENILHLGIGEHNKPFRTGHEVDHGLYKHEVDVNRIDKVRRWDPDSQDPEKIKEHFKDILKDSDKIHDYIYLVNNEHNTADRGAVVTPFLGSKSVTKKELDRYASNSNNTNYNKVLQGYTPPSLDYHTDPETIKKIKEYVKDQKIIDDYLNTNRNWI